MPNKYNFHAETCSECGQTKTYLIPIDYGTVLIMRAFQHAIRRKGINMIHPKKEMEIPAREWSESESIRQGKLTSNQIGNFTRARIHGLLARSEQHAGNWVLTKKGYAFLTGQRVPRLAIIEKSRKAHRSHKLEYFEPETITCTISEIKQRKNSPSYFEPIDFEIVVGEVVPKDQVIQKHA